MLGPAPTAKYQHAAALPVGVLPISLKNETVAGGGYPLDNRTVLT
jgi:hypothetical protein